MTRAATTPYVGVARRETGSPSRGVHACVLGLAVAISLTTAAGTVSAEPNRHVLRQLTSITVGEVETPEIRSQEGQRVAFVGTGDVLGIGTSTANKQIYMWEENLDTGGTSLLQVTNGMGCDSYDPARPTDGVFSGSRPEIIAFVSNCDFDPNVDNSDGNPEIFFWEIDSGIFHQVTDTPAGVTNGKPFVSDSTRCIVFESNGDLDDNTASNPNYDDIHPGPGFSNIDGSREIFMMSKISGEGGFPVGHTFTQVSNGPAGTFSRNPVVGGYWFARQCQTTVWESDHDQLDLGTSGIHLWIYHRPDSVVRPLDYPGEMERKIGLTGVFPDGDYLNPHISAASPFARGPHVVFEVGADLWANGSEGFDIFDYRVFHPRLTQYTNTGSSGAARTPNVSDGGGVISFNSTGELLKQKRDARIGGPPPFNADGNDEIFRVKGRNKIFQLTRSQNCTNDHATLDDSGRRITWRSTCDLIPGANPNNLPQIFVWSLEKLKAPLMLPGGCLQVEGCCSYDRKAGGCYEPVFGKKPKPSRPNCVQKSIESGRERCK